MYKKKIFQDDYDWVNERNRRKNRDKERRDNKQRKKEKEETFIEEWNTEQ